MNYSEKQTYGRKIVKGTIKEKNVFQRKLFISWGICFLIGLLVGCIVAISITFSMAKKEFSEIEAEIADVKFYGSTDGKIITDSFDYLSSADSDFVPLDVPMDEEIQGFIYHLSYGYNIEFSFVMALIKTESDFKYNLISSTNDYGLMQINTCNHKMLTERLGVTDFLDPYQNIRSGIYILSNLFEKYEDPTRVLMCYNMGETGAARLWEKGVHESRYSNKILKIAAEYEKQIEERG